MFTPEVTGDGNLAAPCKGTDLAPKQINFPAFTADYRVAKVKCGLGLVANRKIKKGEIVFPKSYEFCFADVQEGDVLRFDRFEKANRCSSDNIPTTFPLTYEILTRTHGVPVLKADPTDDKIAGIISWQLETPGMLMNHSCDPNVIDDSYNEIDGEGYATRDIESGEELTCDYTFQFFDKGPFFEKCICGSANCRGKMMGFKGLTDEQKEEVWPFVSEAVKAMYEAETGIGLPVKQHQTTRPPHAPLHEADAQALRLVVPGPSHASAPVLLKPDEGTGRFGLYATKDFLEGDLVYKFWTQAWPEGGTRLIDIVFSRNLDERDPLENTVVRVEALEYAKRDRNGVLQFSGFDLFTQHSCDPNMAYTDILEDQGKDWHSTYAVRPIQKGELLTVDLNTILWDRTGWEGLGDGICACGAKSCRGFVKGFRFLSLEEQEELRLFSWKRRPPPDYTSKKKGFNPGEAMTPHVRVCWRQSIADTDEPGALASGSSSDESSPRLLEGSNQSEVVSH